MLPRLCDAAAALLLLLFFVFALCTFRDYGITLDEWVNQQSGELVLQFLKSLGEDRRAFSYVDTYFYGPWYQVVVAWFGEQLPLPPFEARHLIGGLTGVTTAVAAWALGRQVLGAAGGLLTLVFLFSTGYFVGNVFNNPIDTPFMLAMTLSLVAINGYLRRIDRPGWQRALPIGLAVGLAFATRIGGVLYLFNLFLCQAVWLAFCLRPGAGRVSPVSALGRFVGHNLLIGVVAFAIGYALWPWLWPDPVGNLPRALFHFSNMPLSFEFPFFGRMLTTSDLPLWYIPANLAVRLPEALLLCLVALPVAAFVAVRGTIATWADIPRLLIRLNVGLGWLLPIATVLVTRPTLYDGFRHLLFILSPLAVTSAGGLLLVLRHWRRLGIVFALVVLAGLTMTVVTLVRLHPYEYVYFNRFVGGPAGAAGRFDLDYWGSSLGEGVEVLIARLRDEAGADVTEQPLTVEVCDRWHNAGPMLPSAWRLPAGIDDMPQFAIAFERNFCHRFDDYPVYAEVSRMGAVLATIRDLRHSPVRP